MNHDIEVTEDGKYILHIERPLHVSDEEMHKIIDRAIKRMYEPWDLPIKHTFEERMKLLDAALSSLGFVKVYVDPPFFDKNRKHIYRKFARGSRRNDLMFGIVEWNLETMSEDDFLKMIGKLREGVHGQN